MKYKDYNKAIKKKNWTITCWVVNNVPHEGEWEWENEGMRGKKK